MSLKGHAIGHAACNSQPPCELGRVTNVLQEQTDPGPTQVVILFNLGNTIIRDYFLRNTKIVYLLPKT